MSFIYNQLSMLDPELSERDLALGDPLVLPDVEVDPVVVEVVVEGSGSGVQILLRCVAFVKSDWIFP